MLSWKGDRFQSPPMLMVIGSWAYHRTRSHWAEPTRRLSCTVPILLCPDWLGRSAWMPVWVKTMSATSDMMPKCAPRWLSHLPDSSLRQERLPCDTWAQSQGAKLRLFFCKVLSLPLVDFWDTASSAWPWVSEWAGQKTRHQTRMPKWTVISWGSGHDPVDCFMWFGTYFSLSSHVSGRSLFPCHPDTDSLSYKFPWLFFFSRKKIKRQIKKTNYK
jgi:hypothetical protein